MKRNTESLSYPADFLEIISEGLKHPGEQKKIIIIGAGLAGLITGSLLKSAGHDITILEANERIGGRIFTIRQPFSDGNYLNAGAMRIPSYHDLVHAYLNKFHLQTHPFITETPEDILLINHIHTTRQAYEENPDILQIPLPPTERGKTAAALFDEAIQPFLTQYQQADDAEKKALRELYKNYSIEEFLLHNPTGPSLSKNAVYLIGIMSGFEAFPQGSFVNIVTAILEPLTQKNATFTAINNGNDLLPLAIYQHVKENTYLNQRVTAIDGSSASSVGVHTSQGTTFRGDFVVSAIPFPLLQFIDIQPKQLISFQKWQLIRRLNHVPSLKIGIEFQDRFWEDYSYGNAITDLPIGFSYIPSQKGKNVMIVSYTWGERSLLWISASPKLKCEYILQDLAKIYGVVVYQAFKKLVYFNWSLNPYSAGCFSLLNPTLSAAQAEEGMKTPAGRIYFAGDQVSSFNGWMEGAIESGIQTAFAINHK
ncbi:FAD-dependent oxidoreductase [Oceanobacillus sp. CFH 90083]|uniref:flavin monoamine oxidase family protein n=1 Tax=Oceanobacillus sp. CFH 90083 TaxID=2592336 RepID=UPI00128BB90A|nr:FAD-dependent oxidoreductase [Oceanobacillus sp. CFH 90083]